MEISAFISLRIISACYSYNTNRTHMFLKWEKDKMMITTVVSIPMTVAVPMKARPAVSDVG